MELADPTFSSGSKDAPKDVIICAPAYGEYLYDNFVFDMPLLLDIAAVYVPTNQSIRII